MINQTTAASISPQALYKLHRQGEALDLVDVSTPVEHREVRVAFAQNVPVGSSELGTLMDARRDSAKPLYVMCRGGVRSLKVCRAYPHANLVDVQGGTRDWIAFGLPLKRDRNAISLDRQVRMAAGALVVAGSALGFLAHPYFIALAAAVGAGLFAAGATNTCGMAMLLAKMPWNRSARPKAAAAQQSYSH